MLMFFFVASSYTNVSNVHEFVNADTVSCINFEDAKLVTRSQRNLKMKYHVIELNKVVIIIGGKQKKKLATIIIVIN